jgi:SNF family Na+-dependent transporter
MAQVINVEKTAKPNLQNEEKIERKVPLFRKINYILMVMGVVILAVGYICLSGGGSEDPAVFSEKIFDTRRLVVAPILMLLGLLIEIVAIMYHPKQKRKHKL